MVVIRSPEMSSCSVTERFADQGLVARWNSDCRSTPSGWTVGVLSGPVTVGGVVGLTAAQMSYLLEAIDWRNPQHTWRPQSAG